MMQALPRTVPGRALLTLTLWIIGFALHAQQTRVVDGKKYTVHVVEQGQTLFAISRVYAVPVDALLSANPEAQTGLSIGQELLVPQSAIDRREARSAPTLLKDGELEHTVARKETLFGIARQYGVDVNTLMARNPEATRSLSVGMTVVIPMDQVQGQRDVVTRPAMPESQKEHLVLPGETLYSLGRIYQLDPDTIRAANAGLPEGLKAGQIVIIPLAPGEQGTAVALPPPLPPDHVHQLALLLPFAVDRNDSVRSASALDRQFHEPSRIAAQFYIGARMALDSLEKLGLRAEVSVVDVGDDPRVWTNALRRPELTDTELFIGPFHRSAIEMLARSNPRSHIVCPVPQSNKMILGHPMVSKVTPARSELLRHTAHYVAARHALDRIILLRPDIAAEKESQDQMLRFLSEALVHQAAKGPDSLIIARPGRRDLADLPAKLHGQRLNVLVVPSDDVEFVTHLVTKLKPLAGKHRIKVIGLATWLDNQSLAASDLDLLGFSFAAEGFTDMEEPRTREFVRAFRERSGNEVDEYAFLGFDITFFYGKALLLYGNAFAVHLNDVRTEPLRMGFRISRTGPENGFRNEYAVMLQQRELRIERAP